MNIMWYRVQKTGGNSILVLFIYTLIWIGGWICFNNINYMLMEDMIWTIPIIAEVYPLKEIQEYQTFGYCRKNLFRFCILGEGIRAFFYGGIFRTTLQELFYLEYVKIYTEDAPRELVNQYHQCPVWELFLVNMGIFFLLRLIMVFDSTRKYPAFYFANALNKKKNVVMSRKRKFLRVIEVPIFFIGFMSFFIISMGSYDLILRNNLRDKIGIYLVALVGIIILLVILRQRFLSGKKTELEYPL